MKIVTVLGARPQFIKAASLSHAIRHLNTVRKQPIEDIIIHTGQHFDHNMSQVFFDEMNITTPKHRFHVHSSTHGVMTGQIMTMLDQVLIDEAPSCVLVYGDTNSTLAGALCASKLRIPLVHVEAGLRAFNKDIPEEINRVLTDQISDLLFCPSQQSVQWLAKEGITKGVHCVGDIMYDSTLLFSQKQASPYIQNYLANIKSHFVFVTIHRASNTDKVENLAEIVKALNKISDTHSVIFAIHPRTRKIIEKQKWDLSKLHVIDPLSYIDLLYTVKHSQCVLTDSGGLQKEAFFLSKPCITLREETEWVELLYEGVNTLVGTNYDKITSAFEKFKNKLIKPSNVYGSGDTSKKILETILATYGEKL